MMRPGAQRKLLRVIVAMGASLTGASCGSRTPLDEGLLPGAGAGGAAAAAAADDASAGGGEASGPPRNPHGPAITQNAGDAATHPDPPGPVAWVDSGGDVASAVSTDGAARADACPPIPCCGQYSPTCTCLVVCIM